MTAQRTREEKRQIAAQVLQYLTNKGMSRLDLIGTPGLGKSTVDHFFAGDFGESTLTRINGKLATSFGIIDRAPTWWGGYSRDEARDYEGSYLTIRPDLHEAHKIVAYLTCFSWADRKGAFLLSGEVQFEPPTSGFGLIFHEERSELERAHSGQVWMPNGSHLFLFTTYGEGRLRAAIVSDFDRKKRLKGIQLTQAQVRGAAAFIPAACPIAFLKGAQYKPEDLGVIDYTHSRFDEYKMILMEAEKTIILSSCISLVNNLNSNNHKA